MSFNQLVAFQRVFAFVAEHVPTILYYIITLHGHRHNNISYVRHILMSKRFF